MELNPRIPGQYVQLKAKEAPDKVIFTFEGWSSGIPDEVITFGSLWENAAKVAQEFVQQGLQPRDSVAIFMRNHPEFIYGIIGASICGAVFVPIDPRQKGDKLRYQLTHAECKAVLTSTDLLPQLEEVLPQVPGIRLVLATQRPGGPPPTGKLVRSYQEVLREPLRAEPEQRVTDMDHPIQVIYTSGTTGDPKGVVAEVGRWTATGGMIGAVFGYTTRRPALHRPVAHPRQRTGGDVPGRTVQRDSGSLQPALHQVEDLGHLPALRLHHLLAAGRHDGGDLRRAAASG